MRRFCTILFILSTLCLSGCLRKTSSPAKPEVQPTILPSQSIQDYFPLKAGAYWVYQGPVKWTVMNSADVAEETLTWKMEVKRVVARNNIIGYEMSGAPWDLAWYEEGKEPGEYGIIQAGGNFYRTSLDTVLRLYNEDDNLNALVQEDEIFLDTPLVSGKKFCDTFSLTRSDGMYCWNVGEAKQISTENMIGLDPLGLFYEFPIYQGTMPDSSSFGFIPGVGIAGYAYHHHGTVSEVDVDLIEFHPGE